MKDDPQEIDFRTENTAEIRGWVRQIQDMDNMIILVIHTKIKHGGKRYPKDHMIRVRKESKLFPIASLTHRGDLVGVKGPIHPDGSIIPIDFENFTVYYDDERNSAIKKHLFFPPKTNL